MTSASGARDAVKGHLRINIDPLFSRLLIAPQIGKFLDRCPELSLERVTRSLPGDLASEGFDVGIRFGDPAPSSLVIRKLLDTRILTGAAPGYIQRFGRPSKPTDLCHHNCL